MSELIEILSQDDMEVFLAAACDFHDSIIKETHVVNNAYADKAGGMSMDHRFDVHMLVQSVLCAVELVFLNVRSMSNSGAEQYGGATGSIGKESLLSDLPTVKLKFDDSFSIAAEKLMYRIQENWYGNTIRLHGEVPRLNAARATDLGNGWRQCSNCAESWDERQEIKFSRCPNCSTVTELSNN